MNVLSSSSTMPCYIYSGITVFRCDERCRYFGECCSDAETYSSSVNIDDRLKYTCHPLDLKVKDVGYAFVSECPSDTDSELAALCRKGESIDWNPFGWPVYDPQTRLR